VNTGEIISEPAGSIISIFGLDNGYYLADEILPGYGYWVEVSQDCSIFLEPSISRNFDAATTRNSDEKRKEIQSERSESLVTLNMNEQSELYFGFAENGSDGIDPDLNEVNLPPLPPASVFDCRFLMTENNSSITDIRSDSDMGAEFIVSWQAVSYPFVISWDLEELAENGEYLMTDAINGEFVNLDMREIEELVISETQSYITSLQISVTMPVDNNENELPQVTSLGSNYPNPFNPETTIPYQIAQPGKVNIEIYNVKGQRVITLVNEYQEAGYYQAVWQSNVSAGIYFYRMICGDACETRKMVVLK
jgi:hypothetical protein